MEVYCCKIGVRVLWGIVEELMLDVMYELFFWEDLIYCLIIREMVEKCFIVELLFYFFFLFKLEFV